MTELDKDALEAAIAEIPDGSSARTRRQVAVDTICAYLAVADGWRPSVKPLEWVDVRGDGSAVAFTSISIIYHAQPNSWGVRNYPDQFFADNIEEAKAAAQADYEARILSALVALPSPPKEG